jgi:ribonuclease HII
MATANMTISLDRAVIEMAKAQASRRGVSASAWVAKLIRDAAIAEASRRYDEYNSAADDRAHMAAWTTTSASEADRRWSGSEW